MTKQHYRLCSTEKRMMFMWVGEAAMMGDIISLYSPKKPYSITLDSTVLFSSVLCLIWLHP